MAIMRDKEKDPKEGNPAIACLSVEEGDAFEFASSSSGPPTKADLKVALEFF